jgi:uncharacterized protein YqgV (UPF0045/DUF77 family)
MLKKITNAIKGTATKAATAVAGKVMETEWGINKLKEELSKMPIPPQAKMMFTKLIENNPDLLMKVFKEIQEEVSKGKNQMQAGQAIMMKYQK